MTSPAFPIKQLSDLQDVDREILARRSRLAEVRAKLADDATVRSANQDLQELESQLAKQSSIRRSIEGEIQQITEKIQTVDSRLYGGSVTNPRELSAYQEEKAVLERQQSSEEEKLLEVMVAVEDLQKLRDTAQQRYSELSKEREQNVAEWREIDRQLSGELGKLEEVRGGIASEIPASALSTYDHLLRTRNGQAVAKVERGICQGCRITLPNSIVQRARNASGPVTCTSCRRLLYVV